jgi:hypothetical protein
VEGHVLGLRCRLLTTCGVADGFRRRRAEWDRLHPGEVKGLLTIVTALASRPASEARQNPQVERAAERTNPVTSRLPFLACSGLSPGPRIRKLGGREAVSMDTPHSLRLDRKRTAPSEGASALDGAGVNLPMPVYLMDVRDAGLVVAEPDVDGSH